MVVLTLLKMRLTQNLAWVISWRCHPTCQNLKRWPQWGALQIDEILHSRDWPWFTTIGLCHDVVACDVVVLEIQENTKHITGSAVALHCCKAHSKSNRKMENSTSCKIVTSGNFILKVGTRDYVEDVTSYTIFAVDRFSGGFSTNRWKITLL